MLAFPAEVQDGGSTWTLAFTVTRKTVLWWTDEKMSVFFPPLRQIAVISVCVCVYLLVICVAPKLGYIEEVY